jgi:hypothetical protein
MNSNPGPGFCGCLHAGWTHFDIEVLAIIYNVLPVFTQEGRATHTFAKDE